MKKILLALFLITAAVSPAAAEYGNHMLYGLALSNCKELKKETWTSEYGNAIFEAYIAGYLSGFNSSAAYLSGLGDAASGQELETIVTFVRANCYAHTDWPIERAIIQSLVLSNSK